jgi:hypothetical protein
MDNKCRTCKFWRDKAWTDKGWGVCDNPLNELAVSGIGLLSRYLEGDQLKVMQDILDIRYPEDFGCIFYKPIDPIKMRDSKITKIIE